MFVLTIHSFLRPSRACWWGLPARPLGSRTSCHEDRSSNAAALRVSHATCRGTLTSVSEKPFLGRSARNRQVRTNARKRYGVRSRWVYTNSLVCEHLSALGGFAQ